MAGFGELWFYGKYVAPIIAGLLAIFYSPKKAMETWRWYLDTFLDSKVRRALNGCRSSKQQLVGGKFVMWGLGVSLSDLARQCGISEASARARLRRLEKRGEAIDCQDDDWKAPDKYEG